MARRWVTFRWARSVGLIDVASRKMIKTIRVGKSPHGIYFARARRSIKKVSAMRNWMIRIGWLRRGC
jgi:YVTN family beta-propeller protein